MYRSKNFYWDGNLLSTVYTQPFYNITTPIRPSKKTYNIFCRQRNVKCEIAFNMPLTLATDASPAGIGAVLPYVMPDGAEKLIAFASRALSNSEKTCSQIGKEATAIVWRIKKFFQYCYGRIIVISTDNRLLTSIFHSHKSLPAMSAVRLLYYVKCLSGFNYDIRYRKTDKHETLIAIQELLSLYLLTSRIFRPWCKFDKLNICL